MKKRTNFTRVLSILILLTGLILLTTLPTILAANTWGWGGGYQSPLYYFDNEWVWFTTIFLVFFAIIYFTVNRAFKNNIISGVLALSLSALIGITMMRSGWLYGYVGDGVGTWIAVVVVLIAAGFLIRFAYEGLGMFGVLGTLAFLWFLLQGSDPYLFFPYDSSGWIIWIYERLKHPIGLIGLLIIGFIASRVQADQALIPRTFRQLLKG